MPESRRAAVFLDRDGVLNADTGYVHRLEDLRILDGVPAALVELRRRGYALVVVTNQSGVARGYYPEGAVHDFNRALADALQDLSGVSLDAFYVCPHHPEATVVAYRQRCTCRKPEPGMVRQAAEDLKLDLSRSYMVGDRPDDIECALKAGVKGIQVLGPMHPPHPKAIAHVTSLHDALAHIS